MACKELIDLMEEHVKLINRNLEGHKYFQYIENDATIDFINKYSWIMKEVYCGRCSKNQACESYDSYLKTREWKRKYGKRGDVDEYINNRK